MDYVFFVYGLSFFCSAASASIFRGATRSRIAWQWLGAFGMLHGGHEWLDLAAMSLGDDPVANGCDWPS